MAVVVLIMCTGVRGDNLCQRVAATLPNACTATTLALNGNDITGINDGALGAFSGVQALYLNDNKIVSLTQNAFVGMYSLAAIYLNNNVLQSVGDHTFDVVAGTLNTALYDNAQLVSLPVNLFAMMNVMGGITMDTGMSSLTCIPYAPPQGAYLYPSGLPYCSPRVSLAPAAGATSSGDTHV
ncbi:hypothetical protein PBRA_007902 [Plasmodiophora brassicae]|uniref:LRRNT domain-containing protein n=1 Tax=Plasmodiophora brassicae TaxID=37360 RepID=A0A0G4IXW8_PLABS|nr:hypothetical protein PBRA_007902 [Plasmodiophora brassicae]